MTGRATQASAPGWTSVFSDALIAYAAKRRDIVAITAAMPGPTGLSAFGERFPDRLFDVGIAEQHAMTSAAGLAMGGLHPVVAIYSTFLNRAFDQIMMDVALHKLPVTMVLDRAGITGNDGASHNGMWDLSLLSIVPGMRVAGGEDVGAQQHRHRALQPGPQHEHQLVAPQPQGQQDQPHQDRPDDEGQQQGEHQPDPPGVGLGQGPHLQGQPQHGERDDLGQARQRRVEPFDLALVGRPLVTEQDPRHGLNASLIPPSATTSA